jgi:hypothetical protein
MPPPKRAHDFIDLTGDDDVNGLDVHRNKRPALLARHSNAAPRSVYSPGAKAGDNSSSQPSASVPPSTQPDPDYLDLTQDDEGPATELYSTHGSSSQCFIISNGTNRP